MMIPATTQKFGMPLPPTPPSKKKIAPPCKFTPVVKPCTFIFFYKLKPNLLILKSLDFMLDTSFKFKQNLIGAR